MEVILKEDVEKLGSRGDVVKVADGYGRNFLLPRRLAIQATAANKTVIADMKNAALRRSANEKSKAEELALQLNAVALTFTRLAGEGDHLFGSVTSSDISAELDKRGFTAVDRRKIQLPEPLKSIGDYTVPIRLHREVTANIKVTVAKEAGTEEAAETKAE